MTESANQEAFMFIPAESKLVKYAYRVAQNIPDEVDIVQIKTMGDALETEIIDFEMNESEVASEEHKKMSVLGLNNNNLKESKPLSAHEDTGFWDDICQDQLTDTYEKIMRIFGKFKHESLNIDGFDTLTIPSQSIDKLNQHHSDHI